MGGLRPQRIQFPMADHGDGKQQEVVDDDLDDVIRQWIEDDKEYTTSCYQKQDCVDIRGDTSACSRMPGQMKPGRWLKE